MPVKRFHIGDTNSEALIFKYQNKCPSMRRNIMKPSEIEFRRIIDKYKDSVYKVAFSYCKNKSDAEDAFQEVFLRYLKASAAFKDEAHEKVWLIRVTINICKSIYRTGWFRKTQPLNEQIPYASEEYELLESVMSLPPKYSTPLHLYYYEDYSIREIAELMGISETNVQTRLYRARKILEQQLKEDGLDYGKKQI
jgi:RNA polymerase sigma-70 factor (ECF subfamily)